MEQARRTYPNELIKKCQKMILERSGKKITRDTAELYLEKLSRYYMLAVKVLDQEEKAKKK
ncbi:MAG: hypothetical protein PHP62_00495 [Candidatus Moranbacteria bacterium]|nr:hypothetical protein [Candidatus Moranbacteria bacterium]